MPCFPCAELQRLDLTHLWQNYINLLCQNKATSISTCKWFPNYLYLSTPTLKYEKSIATIPVWDFVWELIFAMYWLGKTKSQIFPSAPAEISQFQNMASIETNKIKKRMPLFYINFWKLTTLIFCPKWFIHSKGPKNAICLRLSLQ